MKMDNFIPHIPVLLEPSVEFLFTDREGVYIDATLGGGGHSKHILTQLSDTGTLLGVDQDEEALASASRYIGEDPRFIPVKGNFGYLTTRSEEHTSELQSRGHLVCRLLLEKKKNKINYH